MQFLTYAKFGNGHDGSPAVSGTRNTYASCTGSSGATSLTTSLSASAGDIILIHQSRGTGAGQWEINYVKADAGSTLTLAYPLSYTYVTGAQAVLVPQYTGGTLSGAVTATSWNGSYGGIIALMSNGALTISGSLTTSEKGFRYGDGFEVWDGYGYQGEGHTTTTQTQSRSYSGSGGGGGRNASGAGGSYGDANGGYGAINDAQSGSGSIGGVADLTNLYFGGGGGGGTNYGITIKPRGGRGGGAIVIFAKEIVISGTITSNGEQGVTDNNPSWRRAGGGGAGGSILIKTQKATLGSNKITAIKGAGGDGQGGALDGGAGSNGRIRIDYYSSIVSGTTNPTYSSGRDTSFTSAVYTSMI